jgi:cytochrome oxidase Cu insertion factor (SCO1/SenC/PrrC family)
MNKKNSLFIPILLLILFFAPMLIAWNLYSGNIHWTEKMTNHGELLNPMPNFSQLAFQDSGQQKVDAQNLQGKWLMVFISQKPCTLACQDNLYKMRQIRTALGKDRERVQRIIVTYPNEPTPTLDELLKTQYSGTEHFSIAREALAQFSKNNHLNTIASHQGALYFVDPRGNMMMYYPANADPENILRDLKRLLATSQIG